MDFPLNTHSPVVGSWGLYRRALLGLPSGGSQLPPLMANMLSSGERLISIVAK
jgi:hypothetical protein